MIEAVKANKDDGIMALAEAYPEIQANEVIVKLIDKLVELRAKISGAESDYNQRIRNYRNYAQSIPSKWFEPRKLKEIEKNYIEHSTEIE